MLRRHVVVIAGLLCSTSISCASAKPIQDTKPTVPDQEIEVATAFDLNSQVEQYKLRYGLRDTDSKLVDNEGNGNEDLYGVRNFRVVLHGIYYRGGANNKFNRTQPRDNMNPLPKEGLQNLCKQGFSDALYLYPENFETAKTSTSCRNLDDAKSKISYSHSPGLKTGDEPILLKRIYDHIKGVRRGPIYAHCWNGWHASGYVAAISLKQFCGYSDSKAEDYWVRNTDGNQAGYEKIRERIRAFKPISTMRTTKAERELICP
ncbi:MAG: hypothetical protein V4692_05785 [Bdellovibrionota bacterium]